MILSDFQAKPIPPGSSLYYAMLYSSGEIRAAASVLVTFCQEMKNIVEHTSEPQVAKTKLLWWSQEISHLYTGKPQHPLSHLLLPLTKRYGLPEYAFQRLIQAMIVDIDHHRFATSQDFIDYCEKKGSSFCALFCQLYVNNKEVPPEFTQAIGVALQIISRIRHFGQDYQHGKIYIPLSETFSLESINQEHLSKALGEYATLARNYYAKAMQSVTQYKSADLQSMLILTKIYFALLDEMERDHFLVLKQKYSLTPMRKFGIAWRTHFAQLLHQFTFGLFKK